MTDVLLLLCVQCVLGAFDNVWHHELQAKLPQRPAARKEIALHTIRELIYGVVFVGIAWWQWQGAWALLLTTLLAIEIVVTIWDFLVEDATRKLPPLERVLHTVMALNYGAILAMWAPQILRWSQEPTAFLPVSYGALSWAIAIFGAGVLAWGVRDLFATARLGVPEWQRHPMRAGVSANPRTVLVAGGTGFVGQVLVRSLVGSGDGVIVLSRDPATARDRFGPFVEVVGDLDELDAHRRIDAIVHLAGEPLAGGLWTKRRKQRFLDSRREISERIVALIARLERKPSALICASSIGYYGDRGDERLHEDSGRSVGYLSKLTRECEEAAIPAQQLGVRVCWLRIGYVLGAEGGMLKQLIPATRLGGGAVLGDGKQWVSWIHVRDLVRLIRHAIDRPELDGFVNAVAPGAVTQRAFTTALARALRRPVLVRLPARLLKFALGGMAELLLSSQHAIADRALRSGFTFEFTVLDAALADIVAPPAAMNPAAVYVNYDCPVCTFEMNRYQQAAQRAAVPTSFIAVRAACGEAGQYGLTELDLRRRLFARSQDGALISGIDAILAIWRTLPNYRRLAPLAGAAGVHACLEMLYDLAIAPVIWRWSEARLRRLNAARAT